MRPVIVPTADVNSETCTIVRWLSADGALVRPDDLVVEVETSKAVLDVPAGGEGLLLRAAREGEEVPMGGTVAYLFPDRVSLEEFRERLEHERQQALEMAAKGATRGPRASRKARELATRHGVDLAALAKTGLITTQDVEAAIRRTAPVDPAPALSPLPAGQGVERILVLGGGLGATQVLDILGGNPARRAVAILDDNRELWGRDVGGVPVVGGRERIAGLYRDGEIDAGIVSISTSIRVRKMFRELCRDLGVPMTNAIDRTAKIGADVRLGMGNVICAFCHLGVGAVVGDNNFLSAYNSFDHHCVLGSDISTGPSCVASGCVEIGSRVRMGTGIFIEPYLKIGDDVQIASGAVILQSVPAGHTLKLRIGHTVLVPPKSS
ncbi:MAG: bifunctional N-acetylglucosamine-1-phosphate uridyltransferase/glucosamine-1-phosphate acetyltransferase [Acidobacteria bacterium]|nr:bifunctional N-acetylglucosamine-1-phosphate uridyltransferase/glucosamine-1-phosphate acetyltransferase [Acidobacteriota bacterium]